MFCRYCGSEIEDGAKFCVHCGKQLVEEKQSIHYMITSIDTASFPVVSLQLTASEPVEVHKNEVKLSENGVAYDPYDVRSNGKELIITYRAEKLTQKKPSVILF